MTKFCWGQCGYDLYAEIHNDPTNRLVHGIFMPFLVYGFLYGLPALLRLGTRSAHALQVVIFYTYNIYYYTFDSIGASLTTVIYFLPTYAALRHNYRPTMWRQDLLYGAMWLFGAVGIQELFGHTLFEQINSDLLQLPNSIVNAPLFGARALIGAV
jgi:uncharacterized membrane protein YGL010W